MVGWVSDSVTQQVSVIICRVTPRLTRPTKLVQRTREAGHFSRDETAFINRLVPHIQNAIRLTKNTENLRSIQTGVATVSGQFSLPYVLLDEQLKVCFIGQGMQQKIEDSVALSLSGGQLNARDSDVNTRLQRMLQGCSQTAAGRGGFASGLVDIPAAQNQGLRLRVMPLPVEADNVFMPATRAFVIVLMQSPDTGFSLTPSLLFEQYELTEREASLAVLLCQGLPLEAIARHNGVKIGTVRKQLKSVYFKTDTHRQGELIVTLLNGFAANGGE